MTYKQFTDIYTEHTDPFDFCFVPDGNKLRFVREDGYSPFYLDLESNEWTWTDGYSLLRSNPELRVLMVLLAETPEEFRGAI